MNMMLQKNGFPQINFKEIHLEIKHLTKIQKFINKNTACNTEKGGSSNE